MQTSHRPAEPAATPASRVPAWPIPTLCAAVLLLACGGGSGSGSGTPGAPAATGSGAPSQAGAAAAPDPSFITAGFDADNSPIANPERGFHRSLAVVASNKWGNPDSAATYTSIRAQGFSVVRGVALLDRHRGAALPAEVLGEFRQAFANARSAGVKIWLLVSYNFPNGPGAEKTADNVDPPLENVLAHLDQLGPVLDDNRDVIAGLYNGFIGAWGEWHSSSTGLDKDPKRRQIYEKILAVLPADRMMTTRYFEALETLPGGHPTAETAYDQSAASRTGMTNQCYLVNTNDAGTCDPNQVEAQKTRLAAWSRHLPMVAETCEVPTTTRHDDCAEATAENERLHFSVMNVDFYKPTIDKWKEQGCYNDIASRLGYRLQLVTASVPATVAAGGAMAASFVVKNTGYAAPYNPRGLALVLRHQGSGEQFTLPILQSRSPTLDPRNWYRESGEITVAASPAVPANAPAGTYDVLLSLPDPLLAARPEYSIRLASQNVWDAGSGLNLLVRGVQVTR